MTNTVNKHKPDIHARSKTSAGTQACIVMLGIMLWASVAQAELRVLIKFDSAQHRVHRLVEIDSGNPAMEAIQRAQGADVQRPHPGMVSVDWKSSDGTVLLSAHMDDPRLTHAPLSSSGSSPAQISLNDGAYMVSGPSESRFLEIRLPANFALALEAQTWQFELKP